MNAGKQEDREWEHTRAIILGHAWMTEHGFPVLAKFGLRGRRRYRTANE
jgi:hypothetical protein